MKLHKAIAPLLVLFPALVFAHKKTNEPNVPAVFDHAQYVYVEAIDGNEFNPNLLPEDRQAIADVENALRSWGRYMLTIQRSQADLFFVVRRGRLGTGRASIGRNGGPGPGGAQIPGQQGPPGRVVGLGGEAGPVNDFLSVCTMNADGKLSYPLWERTQPDGLDSPGVPLFQEFKRAVDRAYPLKPAGKSKKP